MQLKQTLDNLRERLQNLAGSYSLEVRGISAESQSKLASLRVQGRDFLNLNTDHMRRAVFAEVAYQIKSAVNGGASVSSVEQAISADGGAVAKEIVLARFEQQGVDISLRPLSPGYKAWKQSRGFDPRIGIKTGDLLADISSAEFVLVKR